MSDTSVSERLQSSWGSWKGSGRLASSPSSTYWMISPSSSKLGGTNTPASFKAWFLATAVSEAWLAQAPAWPNCTWKAKGRGFTGPVNPRRERTKAPGNVCTHYRRDPAKRSARITSGLTEPHLAGMPNDFLLRDEGTAAPRSSGAYQRSQSCCVPEPGHKAWWPISLSQRWGGGRGGGGTENSR